MEMMRGNEGSVRQLTTKDSFDKVVAWYTDKLNPIENIKTPGPSAVLTGDEVTAVITAEGDETIILLTEGIDR